jgi:hypothetical protein
VPGRERRAVRHIAHLDATTDEVLMGRLDVGDDQCPVRRQSFWRITLSGRYRDHRTKCHPTDRRENTWAASTTVVPAPIRPADACSTVNGQVVVDLS